MSSTPQLPTGTLIDGRYRILGVIGRGGFAHVYECEHTDLKRPAAVKVLEVPTSDGADFVERFTREGRIIASLRHPNIVGIYDLGVHAETGQPYLAMDRLNGHDLEEELQAHGSVEPERLKRLMLGVLDALKLAHASGVVHKDLKPSNLFIADPGTDHERILLLDFGIAWSFDSESRLTKVGTFAGTPAYVAPEYAQHNQVSPAVDVYQMGLIIGEALSGRPLVDADTPMGVVMAHCNGDVIMTPDLLRSDFGPIIKRATSLSPAARYAEAGAFARALSNCRGTTMTYVGRTRPTSSIPQDADTELQLTSPSEPGPSRPVRVMDRTAAVPAAEKSSPLPWVVALLLVVGAVGFAAKRVIDVRNTPREVAEPTPELEVEAPLALAEVDLDAGVIEEDEEFQLTPRFVITSRPINAVVVQGRKKLGRTPLSLRGDDLDGELAEFQFTLAGYKTKTVSAEVVADGRLDVELKTDAKGPTIERSNYTIEDQQRAFRAMGQAFGQGPADVTQDHDESGASTFVSPTDFETGPVIKPRQRAPVIKQRIKRARQDNKSASKEIVLD